jgi:hypothetical protein
VRLSSMLELVFSVELDFDSVEVEGIVVVAGTESSENTTELMPRHEIKITDKSLLHMLIIIADKWLVL